MASRFPTIRDGVLDLAQESPTPPGSQGRGLPPPPSLLTALTGGGDLQQGPEPRLVCGMLPPMRAGVLVCAFAVVEALLVIQVVLRSDRGAKHEGPMDQLQVTFFDVMANGDIIAASLGLLGLVCATRCPPATLTRLLPTRSTQRLAGAVPVLAALGVGASLAWRAVVALAALPWASFSICFAAPAYTKPYFAVLAAAYIVLNWYMAYVLYCVLGAAVRSSRTMQEELLLQAAEGSAKQLLGGEFPQYENKSEEPAFCRLPLDGVVAAYAMCVGIMCLWLLAGLIVAGNTGGGWNVFGTNAIAASYTKWMEGFVYFVSAVAAAMAVSAAIAWRRGQESGNIRKRSAGLMLVFFVSSVMRFGLSVPITVMALAAQDLCGLFTYGLAVVALDEQRYGGAYATLLRCGVADFRSIAMTTSLLIADGCLIVSVLKLWARYRASSTPGRDASGPPPQDAPLFGKDPLAGAGPGSVRAVFAVQ